MQRTAVRLGNPSKLGLLESELESGESLLWSGEPEPKRTMRQCIPIFIFGVAWVGFNLNFAYNWLLHSRTFDWGFCLFEIPFQLIGFGLLLSPYIVYRDARQSVYGITSRRILIIGGGRGRKVESYDHTRIGDLKRTELPDGSGDLAFAQEGFRDSDGQRQTRPLQFIGIPDVRSVEALLRRTFLAENAALPR